MILVLTSDLENHFDCFGRVDLIDVDGEEEQDRSSQKIVRVFLIDKMVHVV